MSLTLSGHSAPLRKVKAGTQARTLKAGPLLAAPHRNPAGSSLAAKEVHHNP